jgi:DNA-binding response OmpR family regulator
MPRCNGESLVRAIRADLNLNQTPIMLLTAHRDEDRMKRITMLGISGCLFKGEGMLELARSVAAILNP